MKKNTIQIVRDLANPIVSDLGLSLWDIRFEKEGANWFLRIFIDKDGGVSIEDCEAVSKAIDSPLDKLDPIPHAYCLEVSSPGLERELISDEHFEAFIGAEVKVNMIRPLEPFGKEINGILKNYNRDEIILTIKENEMNIKRKDTAWIKLNDFDNLETERFDFGNE